VGDPIEGSASVAAPVDGSFGVEGGDTGSLGTWTSGTCTSGAETSGAGRDGVLGTSTEGAGGRFGVEGREGSCWATPTWAGNSAIAATTAPTMRMALPTPMTKKYPR
jgi:hypothetical protein